MEEHRLHGVNSVTRPSPPKHIRLARSERHRGQGVDKVKELDQTLGVQGTGDVLNPRIIKEAGLNSVSAGGPT